MERPDFQTLKSPKTHEPIDIEHNRGITGGLHPMCKLGYFYPRGGRLHMRETGHHPCIFSNPRYFYLLAHL